MKAAVWAEAVKLSGSTVGRVGSLAIVVGISVLSGTMLVAASTDDPQLLAKLGPVADGDWNGFLLGAAQITGAGGLGGFAVVLAWMFGREFGDGTITGLFALPVRRSTIAMAKLLVYGVWAAAMSILLAVVLLAVGTVAGLGPIDSQTWDTVSRQIALGIMSAAITVPVAWAATLSRSVLGGVSVAIGLVVVAQVSVLVGIGGWMPLAAPALWALSAGSAVTRSSCSWSFRTWFCRAPDGGVLAHDATRQVTTNDRVILRASRTRPPTSLYAQRSSASPSSSSEHVLAGETNGGHGDQHRRSTPEQGQTGPIRAVGQWCVAERPIERGEHVEPFEVLAIVRDRLQHVPDHGQAGSDADAHTRRPMTAPAARAAVAASTPTPAHAAVTDSRLPASSSSSPGPFTAHTRPHATTPRTSSFTTRAAALSNAYCTRPTACARVNSSRPDSSAPPMNAAPSRRRRS